MCIRDSTYTYVRRFFSVDLPRADKQYDCIILSNIGRDSLGMNPSGSLDHRTSAYVGLFFPVDLPRADKQYDCIILSIIGRDSLGVNPSGSLDHRTNAYVGLFFPVDLLRANKYDCIGISNTGKDSLSINRNYYSHSQLVYIQVLSAAVSIKSIYRPQQPFLACSNDRAVSQLNGKLLGYYGSSRSKNVNKISTKKDTSGATSHSSKRGSFSNLLFTMTEGYILSGSGSWLIPMALLDRMSEHDSRNASKASLRANPPSQSPSFHLSFLIAIITGDYRLFSYTAKTTLVSLLGYNSAILYSSHFPLLLSGPLISNPPTSISNTNHLFYYLLFIYFKGVMAQE